MTLAPAADAVLDVVADEAADGGHNVGRNAVPYGVDDIVPAGDPMAAFVVPKERAWRRAAREIISAGRTLVSAAVYATLIVTFGFQVARVEGLSMAPTLEDQDRLIVNKLVYGIGEPRPGDIVMLYYPVDPDKLFVKRVIAKEGDRVRIVDGTRVRERRPATDDYVPDEFRSHDDWGPEAIQPGLLLRHGRSPQQQLRQPHLGLRAEEVHRRQGQDPLVADSGRPDFLATRRTGGASRTARQSD